MKFETVRETAQRLARMGFKVTFDEMRIYEVVKINDDDLSLEEKKLVKAILKDAGLSVTEA